MEACSQPKRNTPPPAETKASRKDSRSASQKEESTPAPKKNEDAAPANVTPQSSTDPVVVLPLALHLSFTGTVAKQDASGSGTNNPTKAAAPVLVAPDARKTALEMEAPPETAGGGAAVVDADQAAGEIAFAARVTPNSNADSPVPNTRLSIQSPLPATGSHAPAQPVQGANSTQTGDSNNGHGGHEAESKGQPADNPQEAAPKTAPAAAVAKNALKPATEAAAAKDPSASPYSAAIGVSSSQVERRTGAASTANASAEPAAAPADNDLKTIQANATSVRSLAVNISGSEKNDVQVRFSEVGGEVRVSVRSSDPQINNQLRDSLTDLTGRLTQTGHQAETWRPAEASSTGTGQDSGRNAPGQGDGSHSGRQQNQQQRGQSGDSGQEPQWLAELEKNMNAGPNQTGKGL
jgi:hypothetical protein